MLVLPACVTKLMADCEPTGPCRGTTAGICFDSGVHATSSKVANPFACGGETSVTTVTKPDGSLCYSFETYAIAVWGCEGSERFFWKDSAGVVVASGALNPDGIIDPYTTKVSCANEPGSASCERPPPGSPKGYDGCCELTSLGTSYCPNRFLCPSTGTCQ